ncbi:MAG: DeoR/GlpR family DNA-binding transcription regulator [Bacteroidota bacterium]
MQEYRRSKIAEIVREKGIIKIGDIIKMFDVSEVTAYRDLICLEEEGVLKKIRGGAVDLDKTEEVQWHYRLKSSIEEKRKIARKMRGMISDGDVILMDGSTTCVEVAKLLQNNIRLTVYTNNPLIMNELINVPSITIYFLGGLFSRDLACFVGPDVENTISKIKVTKGIMGASAISPEFGVTGPFQQLVAIQRKIISVSSQVFILADHTKFNKVALEKMADFEEIDYIITDPKCDEKIINGITKTNVLVAR